MPNTLDGIAGSNHLCNRSAALRPMARKGRAVREVPAGLMPEDRVDFLAAAGEDYCGQDGVHHGLVQRIRRSIAAGDYLTSEKIDVTVGCICRELLGRRQQLSAKW